MRLTTLHTLSPVESAPHTLRCLGARGEAFAVTVLDHDLIRVQHHPDGEPRLDRTWLVVGSDGDTPREGRSRDDLSPFLLPPVAITQTDLGWEIQTDALQVDLHREGHLEWQTRDGIAFAADLPRRAYSYDRAGRMIAHCMRRREDEHYYGFGERAGALDKRGMRMEMRNLDALGYNAETSDPLYKHVPFYITWIPSLRIAYGLFYDNLATTVFDMGREIDAFWGFYRTMQAEDGDLDYTLIYGPSIAAVVEKYTRLTGRPARLPRWALGYLGSTMSYTEAPDAQEQLRRFVALCQQHDIPCDGFHLSSGYTTDTQGRRNVFTWNTSRVPNPRAMAQTFHDAGIRIAANIKPYLLTTHPRYEEVRALGGFIRDPDTGEPALCRFWSGGAFESGEGAYIDFTSAVGYGWWKAQVKEALFAYGIDAPWNDNNEFELWDDEAVCAGFGSPIRMALARPLQTLLMARASYEAALEFRPDEPPFVLSRSGCSGIQRYVQTWSGDNETSWHTLRWNIPMGLGMSLSGIPNVGHDVGGFFGPAPDPELFARWVGCGIFLPRFTIHSWNTDGTVNEPWMHPDVLPVIRDLFRFRYRLMPYLHGLMEQAHATGAPIMRPLVYEFPDDPRCTTESFTFLLGAHLLVAPVLEPGARAWRVYLPAGTAWCEWHTGIWHAGGQEIEVDAPLERVPLFVREGGTIELDVEGVEEVRVFARTPASRVGNRQSPPPTPPHQHEGLPERLARDGAQFQERNTGPGEENPEHRGWAHVQRDPRLWEAIKPLAREKRKEMTLAERRLWETLRRKRLGEHKFRSQHPIDRFIVDFFNAEFRLVIEVDGETHDYTQEEDALRTEFLESLGLRVLRFRNEEVIADRPTVLAKIDAALQGEHSASSPSPSQWGGVGVGTPSPSSTNSIL